MTYQTFRFGAVECSPERVHRFPEGLPGLDHLHEFIFIHDEETEPIFWMQSTQDPQIALPVAEVFALIEDYSLDIGDDDLALLHIHDPEEVMVLVVVVIPRDVQTMTANLAAPIVIQRNERLGKQIFTADTAYSVRHPIFEAVMRVLEGGQGDAGTIPQGE